VVCRRFRTDDCRLLCLSALRILNLVMIHYQKRLNLQLVNYLHFYTATLLVKKIYGARYYKNEYNLF
jgi:hypothetical protein